MAVFTSNTAADVERVFACCNSAIVAGATGADDLGVINRGRWNPQCVAVAVFAHIRGLDMRQILAGGGGAIVAADAVARDTGVIEAGR